MTETDIIVPIDVDETNFFIIYPNPVEAAKLLGSMASNYLWCEIPLNIPNG